MSQVSNMGTNLCLISKHIYCNVPPLWKYSQRTFELINYPCYPGDAIVDHRLKATAVFELDKKLALA